MTRFLLLGHSGFLGQHIYHALCGSPEAQVVTAGRRPADPRADHLPVDLAATTAADLADLLTACAPEVVINAAGLTGGEPGQLMTTNVTGTHTLVEAVRRLRPSPRLVHLGSAAEYGRVAAGVPVVEDAPTRPTTVYGATKLAGSRLVLTARAAGVDAVVLRVFNPVGPGAPPASLPGRLAGELRRARKEGQDEIRLGPLDDHRDFVDVRDVAEAVVAVAWTPGLLRPVLNVGSGRATPIRALVDELVRIACFTGAVRQDAAGSARSAQVPWQQADITAIRECVGWHPRRSLRDSLSDLWDESGSPAGAGELSLSPRRPAPQAS